jgi:hypothetical protein
VDRVVLNAWFPMGVNPGGLRTWWRRLHGSDDRLDDTHLMRMAGRFARRVKAWAAANGVPLIFCKAGERKHRIAEEYLETHVVSPGVFLVLAAKAPASVWKVHRSAEVLRGAEQAGGDSRVAFGDTGEGTSPTRSSARALKADTDIESGQ